MSKFKEQVLARLDALELAIMDKNQKDSSKLRIRKVDGTTPMNTVIIVNKKRYFFYKLHNGIVYYKENLFPNTNAISGSPRFEYTVDTEADLRHRLFINAPSEYVWGAVDKDGIGWVFKFKPQITTGCWDCGGTGNQAIVSCIRFNYYKDEWDKTLVHRWDYEEAR